MNMGKVCIVEADKDPAKPLLEELERLLGKEKSRIPI